VKFFISLHERLITVIVTLIVLTILLTLTIYNTLHLLILAIIIIPILLTIRLLIRKLRRWGKLVVKHDIYEVYEKGIYVKFSSKGRFFDFFIPWSDVVEVKYLDNDVIIHTQDGSEITIKNCSDVFIKTLQKYKSS